jgi:predicted nuclease of predicted toxin-antitoxin system
VSVPLYMDHHVDAAITQGLRRRGIDVLTSRDDGTDTWDDEPLLRRATDLGRALFSQDDDFLAIAHRFLSSGRPFAGLIYGHQLDLSIGEVVRDLELIAQVYDPEDLRDRVEYLPL